MANWSPARRARQAKLIRQWRPREKSTGARAQACFSRVRSRGFVPGGSGERLSRSISTPLVPGLDRRAHDRATSFPWRSKRRRVLSETLWLMQVLSSFVFLDTTRLSPPPSISEAERAPCGVDQFRRSISPELLKNEINRRDGEWRRCWMRHHLPFIHRLSEMGHPPAYPRPVAAPPSQTLSPPSIVQLRALPCRYQRPLPVLPQSRRMTRFGIV